MQLANRKGVRLGLVVAVAVTGLVGVTSLTASGQTSPGQEQVGELVLTVPGGSVRTATVEVFKTGTNGARIGGAELTQVFTTQAACPTLESSGASVLSIGALDATTRLAVLPNNGIGVTDNTSCGSSAAVVGGEALRLTLLADTLPGLFGGDVDVRGGSITVFRDNGGGNLQVGFDGGTPGTLGTVGNGLNDPIIFIAGFEDYIDITSTSSNANKGIYLRGATFKLFRDIANRAPVAGFTSVGNGLTVDFTDTSTDPDGNATIVKWEWNFGDGSAPVTILRTDTVTNGNVRRVYATANDYQVTLKVTDNLNGTNTITNPAKANRAPVAGFTSVGNGLTVDFTDTSTDPDGNATIVKWEWNFGDGSAPVTILRTDTVTNGNVRRVYATANDYQVTLKVTDNLGGTNTVTNPAKANQTPVANFTSLADGLTVDFTDTSTEPDASGTIVKWEWNFGDGSAPVTILRTDTVTNGNVRRVYTANGDKQVTLKVTDNLGGTNTITKTVGAFANAVFCSKEFTGSGAAATAAFLRGENGLKYTDACADVGVVIEVGNNPTLGDYVFWNNSFKGVNGTDQDVNGLVTINWAPIDPADSTAVARLNTGLIDYDGFADGIGPKPQSYCLSFAQTVTTVNGKPVYNFTVELPDWPWFFDAAETMPEPGFIMVGGDMKVPWCLVSDTRVVNADGKIVQTEVLFGRGDPIRYK